MHHSDPLRHMRQWTKSSFKPCRLITLVRCIYGPTFQDFSSREISWLDGPNDYCINVAISLLWLSIHLFPLRNKKICLAVISSAIDFDFLMCCNQVFYFVESVISYVMNAVAKQIWIHFQSPICIVNH